MMEKVYLFLFFFQGWGGQIKNLKTEGYSPIGKKKKKKKHKCSWVQKALFRFRIPYPNSGKRNDLRPSVFMSSKGSAGLVAFRRAGKKGDSLCAGEDLGQWFPD